MRVGEKETSEQAAIVARYADLFTREQHAALKAVEDAAAEGEPRAALPAAGGLCRRRSSRELAEARTARERRPRRTGRVQGRDLPLRTAQAKLALLDDYARARRARAAGRRRLRRVQRRPARAARARRRRSTPSSPASPIRSAQRGAQGHRPARALGARWPTPPAGRMRPSRRSASAGSTGSSARSARTSPCPAHVAYVRRLSPLAELYTKERAVPVCLETLTRLGFDLAADSRIQLDLDDRPAEEPACLRDRLRSARGRPPDHPRAGRAARLPGASPRGGARPALRGLRPGAAVHVPPALARPRADRDLLVPGRVGHARARLARGALRPRGRRGRGARGGARGFSRCSSSAATRPSSTTSSSSGPTSRTRRPMRTPTPSTLREAIGFRYRAGRLPRGHGRRLLLGRLPARLDPRRAAPRVPARHDRRRLVGARRDRRLPARPLPRGHPALRARRSRGGSASTRWIPLRSWTSSSSPASGTELAWTRGARL